MAAWFKLYLDVPRGEGERYIETIDDAIRDAGIYDEFMKSTLYLNYPFSYMEGDGYDVVIAEIFKGGNANGDFIARRCLNSWNVLLKLGFMPYGPGIKAIKVKNRILLENVGLSLYNHGRWALPYDEDDGILYVINKFDLNKMQVHKLMQAVEGVEVDINDYIPPELQSHRD